MIHRRLLKASLNVLSIFDKLQQNQGLNKIKELNQHSKLCNGLNGMVYAQII